MTQLGCGLFGLAPDLEADFTGTMKSLAQAGFTAVEPLLAFENDPALLPDSPVPSFLRTIMWDAEAISRYQPLLADLGLSISSMHVGFLFGKTVEEGCEEMLAISEKYGVRHFMTSLEFDTVEKTIAAASLCNKAAELLQGSGVTLGYHNHYQEFNMCLEDESGRNLTQKNSITEKNTGAQLLCTPNTTSAPYTFMDLFLTKTVPDVKLQLDVGWQMYAGYEILPFMNRYAPRIQSVHLKDFVAGFDRIPEEDSFAAIGDGVLPTADILAFCRNLSLIPDGLMIDQDRSAKDSSLIHDLEKGASFLHSMCS